MVFACVGVAVSVERPSIEPEASFSSRFAGILVVSRP
jgi:hypothetical protein